MSLGVLNNISAMYAENNLNNTNNSLSTVLQQLSSGSKINSGADDAAGLSLVNGLQANQQALTQSQTNATEGVGLLQVADGALSQVTSLLNRAVTLATEASNGTLNSTQDLAANQEYQSILSEVSNIGSTTTYNQEQVFNSNTNIYTGDSSTKGASIDALNIRSLSATNVGDSSGAMSYSNGTSNVFVDLSKAGQNAAVTDTAATSTSSLPYLATAHDSTLGGGSATTDLSLTSANNNVTTSAYYSVGVSGTVADTSTGGGTGILGISADNNGAGGVATISYSDAAGQSLSQTDLTNAADAQASLTDLNTAISDVSAQDGYIGAMINTLNAVSQVLSTQQENVQSAQNAVQATDYAAATSNMSKYEILSQTGISALAQANSMQQEVTKLLQ